jgi:peptidoglycan hydrolase-like protein with peptidoglycan-binding domain
LAQQGYSANRILESYYGNIETVQDAPIRGYQTTYPGSPLQQGSTGPNVVVIQTALNRISQNYPAIPKIPAVDGIFGPRTEAAVRAMQSIFGLKVDGIVGRATWYELVRLYTAVTQLAELRSQGQQFYSINWSPPNALQTGDSGEKVQHLQYMLSVLSSYISEIPPLTIDGIFGQRTRAAVLAAQRRFQLPETGVVDAQTWDEIYDQFSGIENTSFRNNEIFPNPTTVSAAIPAGNFRRNPSSPASPVNYARSTTLTQFPGRDLSVGSRDRISQEVMR